MKREDVLSILTRHRPELQRLGVRRAAVFGSTARGTATESSDIDILVDIDDNARIGVFEYAGIVQFLEDLFPRRVDVAHHKMLKEGLKAGIERDAVYAF
jgi:uncharacterized protein